MKVKKLTYLLFVLSLNLPSSFGQNVNARDNQLTEKRAAMKQQMMKIMDFSPQDNIADIGSGNGENILLIASFYPNMTFTIEDIDSAGCNAKIFSKNIAQNGYKVNINHFKFKYGNEKSTLLPSGTYSKVLMFELVHELTYKTEMLNDIKRILKKDGTLIISDILVLQKVEKSVGCNYPYLTEKELKEILKNNHISILGEFLFAQFNPNKYLAFFKCRPE